MRHIRVLVGDSEPVLLAGLREVLSTACEVVGAEKDGPALVAAAASLQPDVVVLDISLPLLSGIEAARQIRFRSPSTQIVYFTTYPEALFIRQAARLGAGAYVSKHAPPEQLTLAVLRAADHVCSAPADCRARRAVQTQLLTKRQLQVLQLVAEGLGVKEIAPILGISPKTVEFHKYRLMDRLNARSAAQLTTAAIRHGFVSLI